MAGKILEEFAHQVGRIEAATQVREEDTKGLTPRQMEVLTLVARGMTYKEVAATLCLSERTVKYHMGEILKKLHLENRTQVIAWATCTGLVKTSRGAEPPR
jgi:two-component system NarL family response regulator